MTSSTLARPLPISDADGRLDNPDAIREGYAPEVSVRPMRLHTQQVEHGGLGGHCFSADFARYLSRVKPRLVVGWQMRVAYWWASAYGRQRVERAFLRRFGETRGAASYRVALIIASGCWGADAYARLMDETGHTASWLADQAHLALKLANARSTNGNGTH